MNDLGLLDNLDIYLVDFCWKDVRRFEERIIK